MSIRYIDYEDILAILARHRLSRASVRDEGLLLSALGRPQAEMFGQEAYPSLDMKAAALLHSLIASHPLFDGNKRVGITATLLFYGLNGVRLTGSEDDRYDLALAVADGSLSEVAEIANALFYLR